MNAKGLSKKALRFLSLMLAASLFLGTQGFTVFAQTISENEAAAAENKEQENSGKGYDNLTEPEAGNLGAGSPTNPVHHCNTEDRTQDITTWSYICFGTYPQSEVTDVFTKQAIDSAITQGMGQTAGTAESSEGTDVWVNGTRYRRISKDDTNYSGYFNEVTNNGYRYFKWEKIKWKVLQNNGATLFVAADTALDCKYYHYFHDADEGITWEDSSIRSWLNSSFYHTAFDSGEQEAVVERAVVNDDNPYYGTEGGNDTRDKVYLLSIDEVTRETYGFCNNSYVESESRRIEASDYANARGTYGTYNCWWWLRSPGYFSGIAAYVDYDGFANGSGDGVDIDEVGVCPALHINLSSDLWTIADDTVEEEKLLTSIQASKQKTTYEQGEPLNVDDLKVTAYYQFHPQQVLPAGSYTTNAAAIDMNRPGDYELEISYTEKDVTRKTVITITVKKKAIKVRKLTITAPSKKLAAGQKVKLTLKVEPENASEKSVVWETSNKKYAAIDEKGTLTLKKAGVGKTVTITATAKDGSGIKATYKIKIMKHAVKSIKLKAPSKTLKTGSSMIVKATVNTTGKSVNKTLKWQSSNTKYATVSKKGKVTAKKAGKGKNVTITAVSTDGSNKKAKVKIKIK